MRLAHVTDKILQHADPLGEPCQCLVGHLVVWRVARIDTGAPEQLKAPAAELVPSGPSSDQLGRDLLGMRPEEIQLVRLGAVERQNQQGAVIEALCGLMQQEGGLFVPPVRNVVACVGEVAGS
jgi:hypothetical protein